jgi:hypothetical protein
VVQKEIELDDKKKEKLIQFRDWKIFTRNGAKPKELGGAYQGKEPANNSGALNAETNASRSSGCIGRRAQCLC